MHGKTLSHAQAGLQSWGKVRQWVATTTKYPAIEMYEQPACLPTLPLEFIAKGMHTYPATETSSQILDAVKDTHKTSSPAMDPLR